MIFEIILNPIFWLITNAIYLLPSFSLPTAFVSAMTSFFTLVATIGFFIPLDTIGYILTLFLSFYALRFAMALLSYILRKIPFLNLN